MVEKKRTRKRTLCKRTGINFVKEGAKSENKKGWKTSVFLQGIDRRRLRDYSGSGKRYWIQH